MSAAIAAAVDAAIAAKSELELEDSQYAIVTEVIEKPSNPYNAASARFVLPLLEHVLAAGKVV